MRLVLLPEIAEGGENGIGSCPAQGTHASLPGPVGQVLQVLQVFFPSLPLANLLQDLQHPFGSYASETALSAGLTLGKGQKVLCNIDHAIAVIQHHQSTASHHGSNLGQGLKINGRVRQAGRNASP